MQRWLAAYAIDGPAGLIDSRHHRELDPLRGLDQRWLDTCRTVLDEHVDASRPTKKLILERVEARVAEAYGGGVVPIPHRKRADAAMAELTRGTNAFGGATLQSALDKIARLAVENLDACEFAASLWWKRARSPQIPERIPASTPSRSTTCSGLVI